MPWKESQGLTRICREPRRKLVASRSLPTLLPSRTHSRPASRQSGPESSASSSKIGQTQKRQSPVAKRITFDIESPSHKTEQKCEELPSPASSPSKAVRKGSHRDDICSQALLLSRRYMIDFLEVRFALKVLQEIPCARPNGGMEVVHFKKFLARIFDAIHIPDAIWEGAYSESLARDGPLDADKFFLWYRNNMFTSVAFMTADRKMRENDDLIANVARRHGISRVEAGRVKKKFDEYDLDGSGEIEYDEFRKMMASLMGLADLGDIPPDRMNRFWKEIDKDQSGSVDFKEFTDWFLKYFPEGHSGGVVESFYASYSPDVQRTRALYSEDDVSDVEDHPQKLEHFENLQVCRDFRRSSVGVAEQADSRRRRRLSSVYVKF